MSDADTDYEFHPDDMPEVPVLPLDAWHRAQGARMVSFAGYEMPIQYTGENGGIVAEHEWTRNSAGLFDVSHMGQLSIFGEGAEEALERLVPGAISSLPEGKMRYTLLLNEAGGILDDLIVTKTEFGVSLVVNGAVKWEDITHLREHLPDEVTLHYHDDRALIALQGPKAVDALGRLVLGVEKLVFMESGEFTWIDVPLIISRSGYTGEDGFEISVAADRVEEFVNSLIAQPEVQPIGLGARDSLRLEAGLPLYGHDLDTETDPVSADLLFALTKKRRETGGWMGHEKIGPLLTDGAPTKRVGLALEGRLPAREGSLVFSGDKQIGRVTSGGFSPTLGHPIAMAYVDAAHAENGTQLEIEVRKKRLAATVAPMPFVPHNYYRGG